MADLEADQATFDWQVSFAQRGIAFWYLFIAVLCLFGPDSWFGPTWWQFQQIPHGGHGLGYTCLILGVVMVYAIYRRKQRLITLMLVLGATSFTVAAALVAVQGIVGHTGLMESPFMLYVAIDIFVQGTISRLKRRR